MRAYKQKDVEQTEEVNGKPVRNQKRTNSLWCYE